MLCKDNCWDDIFHVYSVGSTYTLYYVQYTALAKIAPICSLIAAVPRT